MEIYRKSAVHGFRDPHFAWKFTGKMHMEMSQEPFCVGIYRKNAGPPGPHLVHTPAPNCDRKNPSVWPHCLGKQHIFSQLRTSIIAHATQNDFRHITKHVHIVMKLLLACHAKCNYATLRNAGNLQK